MHSSLLVVSLQKHFFSEWMFPKIVVPPNHQFYLIGFSIINHPFWGTPIFGNTQMLVVMSGSAGSVGNTFESGDSKSGSCLSCV